MTTHLWAQLALTSCLALLACAPGGSRPSPDGADIVLDSTMKYQVISAWEATAQGGQDSESFPSYRDQLFNEAANDLGITRLRLEVRSGIEHDRDVWLEHRDGTLDYLSYRCLRYATVNDNGDPAVLDPRGFQWSSLDDAVEKVVLPLKQRVEARGDRFGLSLNYVAFIAQMTGTVCPANLGYDHRTPAEYAEFILAAVLHLKEKYALVPDAIEFLLEPEFNSEWPGQKIGEGIVAASERLATAGFDIKFTAPSTTSMAEAPAYFDAIRSVPGATARMLELSYHRYRGVSDANLEAIASRAREAGIGSAMLEHIGSGHEDLHRDLTVGMVSSWQQFTLAGVPPDDGGKYYVVTGGGNDTRVTMGDRTRYLRQYFRWIRPGAQRVGATSRSRTLEPVAFIGPAGRHVVVVKASDDATFAVAGLPPGTYQISYTTRTETGTALPDVTITQGEPLMTTIPAAGVLTIAAR